ncbi:DNA polymerase III subunit gamma/tau [Candidatus Chlamydia sanziniae]|uniref:DNA polymerase III subunit gamma/tau n=1 Tax=Candidatus Chlamydia sanziniae TaxID=1806891 RepID=A0A1A9HT80_9CHLA|nr:DNA polymerase III subunit gamma/tau [Candidatus Chlamydia sanziniae]ANH78189.1 DNA polymerase III subunits gamma and tau [Candidatus Chlamydia sanziniae]
MTQVSYQASSRKYRPQNFAEILGQSSIVTVLKNALLLERAVHAYIFSGIRGTGKTTLARIFTKALNCTYLSAEGEPCNSCASCKEVTAGSSLDVIEIDGASHRGIEDIRQINETVLFSPAKSKYKIYIIDEVHMLTKEAFNALLKTLEEPPRHVKFFLATTEIHKVPSTILSRCQKLHLQRIPDSMIIEKLLLMAQDNSIETSKEALVPIARAAQGSLRDAESLYDYATVLLGNTLSTKAVADALGLVSLDTFCALEEAIRQGDVLAALTPVTALLNAGIVPTIFLHEFTLFYRDLLFISDPSSRLAKIAGLYQPEQLLEMIDFLGESARHLQHTIFEQTFLETSIIHLIRIFHRPTLSQLVSTIQTKEWESLRDPKELDLEQAQPTPLPTPKTTSLYEEQSLLPQTDVQQQSLSKVVLSVKANTSPSLAGSATTDTLLQFAVVEFSGILTKE